MWFVEKVKRMVKKTVLLTFLLISMLVITNIVTAVTSRQTNQKETYKLAGSNGFDVKDDDGFLSLHDVDYNGHMELYCYAPPGGHGWCLVANKFKLEKGKDVTFSVSGHAKGYLESPTFDSIGSITVYMQIYQGVYSRGNVWKEWMIYHRDITGPVDTDISISKIISGDEIDSGYYYVAFLVGVAAAIRGHDIWFTATADFTDGDYCVEAYSAKATQGGSSEDKPDLTFKSGPAWEPNPPEKNENVVFKCTIQNIGKGECKTNFGVQLRLDGEARDFEIVPYYDINDDNKAKVSLSFRWPNDYNEHQVKIIIDNYDGGVGEIEEENENNNVWKKSIAAPKVRSMKCPITNLEFIIHHFKICKTSEFYNIIEHPYSIPLHIDQSG